MRRDWLRIAGRLAALALLVLAGHAALTFALFPPTREELAGASHAPQLRALDACSAAAGDAIVFLGDSVNFSYAPADGDKRRVSEMLQDAVARRRVVTIDHRAYHAGVYRGFVERLGRLAAGPALVLVPVNLRSFSVHWRQNPGWQFLNLQRYLRSEGPLLRFCFRPLRSLKLLRDASLSEVEFARSLVYDGDAPAGSVRDYQRIASEPPTPANTRAMVTYYYMERVREGSQRVQDLVAIARTARARRLPVLFYVPPADVQTCDEVLGGRFSARLRENVGVVREALRREGFEVLDLSAALGREGFYYRSAYPDEHLNERGRRLVAERLAAAVVRHEAAGRGGGL